MATKTVAGEEILKPRRKNTMGVDHMSLRPITAEIERFGQWYVKNVAIDDYTVPVVYTIQTRAKKENKLGHFQRAYDFDDPEGQRYGWSTKEGTPVHEINIVPEAFFGDPYDVLVTVAHEVVHMYNWNCDVQDAAKSGRHNDHFREAAEEFGLVCEKAGGSIGWTTPGFTDSLRERIEKEFKPDLEAFSVFKEALPPPKPVRKSTIAFHVLEDPVAPVIRLTKGKAEAAVGELKWGMYDYVIKSD